MQKDIVNCGNQFTSVEVKPAKKKSLFAQQLQKKAAEKGFPAVSKVSVDH